MDSEQTLQNISTNNEESISGYSKRKAFSNICDSQPTSVMSNEGSSSTTTTTFGWSSSRKVVRRFAAWANDSKMDGWAVGRILDILTWRTLRSTASHGRKTRFAAENWPVCHDTRRNRLCGHGGYCGTTPKFHASRVKGSLFELLRKCEVSAFAARLRSGRQAGRGRSAATFFFFFFFLAKGGLRATCKPREVRACNHCLFPCTNLHLNQF